jgi:hypothetical protein
MRKEKVRLEDDILGLKGDVGNLEEDRDLLESEKFEIQGDIDELNQLMADGRQSPVKPPLDDKRMPDSSQGKLVKCDASRDLSSPIVSALKLDPSPYSVQPEIIEIEHIQTGTFGEVSDRKNLQNSDLKGLFASVTDNFSQDKLNSEQQDLLMKYATSKISELERIISLLVKTYKVSDKEIKDIAERAMSQEHSGNLIDPSLYSKSVNLSSLSKEPLSNDQFLSQVPNSCTGFQSNNLGYSPMVDTHSEITIQNTYTEKNSKLLPKSGKNTNFSNISFALEETETNLGFDLEMPRRIKELEIENNFLLDKIEILKIDLDQTKSSLHQMAKANEQASQGNSDLTDASSTDSKMVTIKNYMNMMREKIIGLIGTYDQFIGEVMKTADILSFGLKSKHDNPRALAMGIVLQKELVSLFLKLILARLEGR